MGRAKRARTAETPTQPSLCLMLRALHFYPDRDRILEPGIDAVCWAEDHAGGRAIASVHPTRRGLRPWHAWTLFARKREISSLTAGDWTCRRAASGRRGAEADDVRAGA